MKNNSILSTFFNIIITRYSLIILGLVVIMLSVFVTYEQYLYLVSIFTNNIPSKEDVDDMCILIDNLASIFVTVGVFLELRETLRWIVTTTEEEDDPYHHKLTEIAVHNGSGILVIGLIMEICTLFIDMPDRVLNIAGLEKYVFSFALFLSIIGIIIMIDFVSDYIILDKKDYNEIH